jgi:hypothetical protein
MWLAASVLLWRPDSPPFQPTGLVRKLTEFCNLVGKPGHYLCLPTAAICNTKHIQNI